MMKLFFKPLIFLMAISSFVLAQIPETISYQGVLADTNGNAVADGNYNLTFRIYDVSSAGTEIWMETQTVAVVDGVFNAILGSATSLNLPFDQPYWLGVSVEGGTELSPRIELTSAPYSLEPDSGSGGDGHSLDAADGDPVDAVYVDNDGKVGVGTVNPNSNSKLNVVSNRRYAGYFTSDSLSGYTHVIHAEYNGLSGANDAYAIYGKSVPAPDYGLGGRFEGGWRGQEAYATQPGPGNRYGVYGYGWDGDSNNYGVVGSAIDGTNTYGIYGLGSQGSSNNYGVYASGNLAYTGNLIGPSDAKLKENIRPLAGSLNKLMQIKPKSFNYNSDEQYAHMNLPIGEHYGLIAQEVEQVLPELVSENSHPSAAESRGEKSDDPPITYKGLNYIELIPILIDAIKEQQAKINQLESKVNQLTNN